MGVREFIPLCFGHYIIICVINVVLYRLAYVGKELG